MIVFQGQASLPDDYLEVSWFELRARRVDERTKPAHVETGAAEVFSGWTVAASLSVVRCSWPVVHYLIRPYNVIVN